MNRTSSLRPTVLEATTGMPVSDGDRQPGPGPGNITIRSGVGLTYDDVLLVPRHSAVRSRGATNTATRFSRRIALNSPIVSANMDTVTEHEMAIALARSGGIGVIHRFLGIARQADEVRRVKRAEALVVRQPLSLPPNADIGRARREMERAKVGGVIVVGDGKIVLGIVTRRDIMFADDESQPLTTVMTGGERLITAPADTTIDDARAILDANRVEKLPLVDDAGRLVGLITAKDIEHRMNFPDAAKDPETGHLRVAAAVGVRPGYLKRAERLLEAGADALVVDIAHGDSVLAIEAARELRGRFDGGWDLIVGNVATADATLRLIDAGADAVKVGIGPGSICITRVVTGFGMPQLSAVAECAAAAAAAGVPIIADGGVKSSGDIVKALAAGASTVMVGTLLAGTRESPGIVVVRNGRRYKLTRGMASLGATISRDQVEDAPSDAEAAEAAGDGAAHATAAGKASGAETGHGANGANGAEQIPKREYERVVPEGVEASVPYRGPVDAILHQLVGGLRSGLSYAGARDIAELQANAEFVRITPAGMRESGPHDVDQL